MQRYVPFNSEQPNHCKRNIPFTLARRICTTVENNDRKTVNLNQLRENLIKQKYPMEIIENGLTKARNIPQSELRKSGKPNLDDNIIPFISTHNPNNPQIYNLIKSTFGILKCNEVPGFKDLRLIKSKRQAPNLKRIWTKAQFSYDSQVWCLRCLYCQHLLLSDHYVFKNTGYKFLIKTTMSCDSCNLIHVIICCGSAEEYIGETGEGDTKMRDRVRVYRQHIRDPTYQQLKVEEHIRICEFKISPFLQMNSKDIS